MSRLIQQGQVLTGAVQSTLTNTVSLIQNQINALKSGNVKSVITNFVDFGVKELDELRHPLIIVSNLLVIIGALNWLAIGLQNKNYVSMYLGNVYAKYIFIAVGIAGLYLIYVKYINYKRHPKKEKFEDISDEQRVLIKAKVAEMRNMAATSGASGAELQKINSEIRDIEKQYGIETYENYMYEHFENDESNVERVEHLDNTEEKKKWWKE